MATLGYAHDDARRVELGIICADCGDAEFMRASNEKVCCAFCKRRGSEYPMSQYEERSKVEFANIARKRRARKNV